MLTAHEEYEIVYDMQLIGKSIFHLYMSHIKIAYAFKSHKKVF